MNILIVIGLIVLIMLVYYQGRARHRELQQKVLEERNNRENLSQRLETLELNSNFLKSSALGVGDRLIDVEKRVKQELHTQVQRNSELLTQPNEDQIYRQQADRLLKGRQIPDANQAGISRSEAKLMELVTHKNRKD